MNVVVTIINDVRDLNGIAAAAARPGQSPVGEPQRNLNPTTLSAPGPGSRHGPSPSRPGRVPPAGGHGLHTVTAVLVSGSD
jgi:hypothetical protein